MVVILLEKNFLVMVGSQSLLNTSAQQILHVITASEDATEEVQTMSEGSERYLQAISHLCFFPKKPCCERGGKGSRSASWPASKAAPVYAHLSTPAIVTASLHYCGRV
jgi:hypothetical protein